MATSDLEIEGQGHKTIAFVALPIYTHIPNLKVLTKIFFKLSRPKGNLCGSGGGVTVLNPKYPRLSFGLHGESCNSSTTLPNMVDGGKVYASRSYHGRLSASTAVARGSGTGDTNRGNLLLNLMANKSILGRCHLLHIEWKTSGRRNHSVWIDWPSLDSLSATTFSRPGMCWA